MNLIEESSPKGIEAINSETVHRICSGQVVLNLATAVKELVENSLDAGASNIEVRLKEYGSEQIEVVDDGHGVEEKNFEGLTLKHHTSKLKDFADLWSVETFGFRGEALSSLCALGELSVVTRHKTSSVGTRLEYDGRGALRKRTHCPREIGSSVIVKNIFSALPVRHKEFLRNLRREYTKTINVLSAYALIQTSVRISCTNQPSRGKKSIVLSSQHCSSVRENIACIFGTKQLSSLLEFVQAPLSDSVVESYSLPPSVQNDPNPFKIEGWISSCAHGQGRSSADRQFFYVNERPCDLFKVSKLVNKLYHSFNRHQYPFVLLNITLEKGSVDVNVTPDKRKIFMDDEKLLLATIESSILQMFAPIPSQLQHFSSPENKSNVPLTNFFKRDPSLSSSLEKAPLKRSFTALREYGSKDQPRITDTKEEGMKEESTDEESVKDLDKSFEDRNRDRSSNTRKREWDTGESGDSIPGSSSKRPAFYKLSGDSAGNASDPSGDSSPELPSDRKSRRPLPLLEFSGSSKESDRYNRETVHSRPACSNALDQFLYKNSKSTVSATRTFKNKAEIERYFSRKRFPSEEDGDASTISDTKIENCNISSSEGGAASLTNEENEEGNREVDDASFEGDVGHFSTSNNEEVVLVDRPVAKNRKTKVLNFSIEALKERLAQRESPVDKETENLVGHRKFRAKIAPSENNRAEAELKKQICKESFEKMEIIGQFNLGFIVTKHDSDLFIIDQHATDEKYNFEMLQRNTILETQKLIQPLPLELTAANEGVLLDNLETFVRNGFAFAVDEDAPPGRKVRLTSVPVSRNWTFGKEDVDELIFMLSDAPDATCRPSRVRQMFASRACRKSVMIGSSLSSADMKKLVCHMGMIEQPWNCPHGRPTIRHLFDLDVLRP